MIEYKSIFSHRNVSLSEARRGLARIIDQVCKGQRIGITRRGKLAAVIVPARADSDLKEVFHEIEKLRQRTRPHKKNLKGFIEAGRF